MFYVIKGRIMVTVHQSSVVLGTGSTFFVPQGEFYYFFVFCTFYGLTIQWVQKVFFRKCDVCGEILVGLKADTSSARAEATGCEATRKWWPLFWGNKPDFFACFSLSKTWPKAETAQEKPLAPRVILLTLLCMFYPKDVWPSRQSPCLIFCAEARF